LVSRHVVGNIDNDDGTSERRAFLLGEHEIAGCWSCPAPRIDYPVDHTLEYTARNCVKCDLSLMPSTKTLNNVLRETPPQ
jgi:hypothetical protein